jgi:hypothetical protein
MLGGFKDVLSELSPSLVVVQGDTKQRACRDDGRVLRGDTGRSCQGQAAHRAYHFAFSRRGASPTDRMLDHSALRPHPVGAANLLREGVPRGRILVVGNTVVDALLPFVSMKSETAGWRNVD